MVFAIHSQQLDVILGVGFTINFIAVTLNFTNHTHDPYITECGSMRCNAVYIIEVSKQGPPVSSSAADVVINLAFSPVPPAGSNVFVSDVGVVFHWSRADFPCWRLQHLLSPRRGPIHLPGTFADWLLWTEALCHRTDSPAWWTVDRRYHSLTLVALNA